MGKAIECVKVISFGINRETKKYWYCTEDNLKEKCKLATIEQLHSLAKKGTFKKQLNSDGYTVFTYNIPVLIERRNKNMAKRHSLNFRAKKLGYKIDNKTKTIFSKTAISESSPKVLTELIRLFNYQVQLILF